MKRIAILLLVFYCFLISLAAVAEEDSSISVVVDGKKVMMTDANGNERYPIISNGTIYLPMKIISDVLGYNISQDIFTRSIVISSPKEEKSETDQSSEEQIDAIITHKDGTIEKTTLKKVLDILAGNSLKFERDYNGASIVAYGKVQQISGKTDLSGHVVDGYICVGFYDASKHQGGWPMQCWRVEASREDLEFVSTLSIGDAVKISGVIWSGFGSSINIYISNGNTTKIEPYTGTLE